MSSSGGWRNRPRRKRRPKLTKEQLEERKKLYRTREDPMIVHRTIVEAERAGLPVPEWVLREWRKWSRKLVKAVDSNGAITAHEMCCALELLGRGPGRGSPVSRGKVRARDASLVQRIDRNRKEKGLSATEAIEETADYWGYTHGTIRNRYYRARKLMDDK